MKTPSANSRQGDVLLLRVVGAAPKRGTEIPRDARGRIVLAEGEVTGHAHVIVDETARLSTIDVNERFAQIMDESGIEATIALTATDRLLEVERATVVHEEHDAHVKAPGVYIVRQPLEFVAPEIVRQIAD